MARSLVGSRTVVRGILLLILLPIVLCSLATRREFPEWTIKTPDITPLANNGYRAKIPVQLHSENWYRRSLMLYEDGTALTLRVDSANYVEQGGGRYGTLGFPGEVADQYLWFSASDNSDPRTNGRSYVLKMTESRGPIGDLPIKAIVVVCLMLFLFITALQAGVSTIDRGASVVKRVCTAAVCALVLFILPRQVQINLPIQARAICWDEGQGTLRLRLPAWFTDLNLIRSPRLQSSSSSLRYVPIRIWEQENSQPGQFSVTRFQRPSTLLMETSTLGEWTASDCRLTLVFYLFPPYLSGTIVLTLMVMIVFGWVIRRGLRYCVQPAISEALRTSITVGAFEIICLLVLCLKFWFVRNCDVIAMAADSSSYATWSLHPFTSMPTHSIGPSLCAWLSRQLGIPWRLFAEALYGVSCYLLCRRLRTLFVSRSLPICVFGSLVFLPNTFEIFTVFLSETIQASATVLIVSTVVRLVSLEKPADSPAAFFELGLWLLLWGLTRAELPLILGTLILVFGGLRIGGAWCGESRGFRVLFLHLVPLLVLLVPLNGLCWYHQARFGVFSASFIEAPGLIGLMKQLYRIGPGSSIKYAPVTRDMLSLACDASPVMAHYRRVLLNPEHPQTLVGEKYVNVEGEPGPMLNWLLPVAVGGDFGFAESNWLMLAASEEVENALLDGSLLSRPAFFPVDPNVSLWFDGLLPSVWTAFYRGLSQDYRVVRTVHRDAETLRPDYALSSLFDVALGRRRVSRERYAGVLRVELKSASEEIHAVLATSAGGDFCGGCVLRNGRGQILVSGPWDGYRDGLGLSVISKRGTVHPYDLRCDFPSSVSGLSGRAMQERDFPDLEVELSMFGMDGEDSTPVDFSRQSRVRVLFPALVGLGFFSCLWRPLSGLARRRVLVLFLVLLAWWAGRSFVIGLLEATMAWGSERYMNTMGCVAVVCSVSIGIFFGGIVGAKARRRSEQ